LIAILFHVILCLLFARNKLRQAARHHREQGTRTALRPGGLAIRVAFNDPSVVKKVLKDAVKIVSYIGKPGVVRLVKKHLPWTLVQ
jgi:hypothetical protein